MLPADIANDNTVRVYIVMPMGAQEPLQQEERWERKPHPMDEPANAFHRAKYYGEWVNKTDIAKAEWEVRKGEIELAKLERQQRLAELRERNLAKAKRGQEEEPDDTYDDYDV